MEWTEKLSVGVGEIDEQHRELFNRINMLVTSIKSARCKYTVGDTIKFLEEYTLTHFGAEENHMIRAGYPALQQHREQHAVFLDALERLKSLLQEPRVPGSSYELSVLTNQVVVD
ncbi:MAG: bacteriohemerythrin [Thermodesulfovibrionales bacterium]